MPGVDGNVDLLTQAVMSEASQEAGQILADAKTKADAIWEEARRQAGEQRQKVLERAVQEAGRLRRQALATAQVRARMTLLDRREKLLNRVFETARQQLPTVQQWSDYDETALSLLREALRRLQAQAAGVYGDAITLKCLPEEKLTALSKELKLELRLNEPLQQGTGLIVEAEDGRRRFDNTLETRLSRMQEALRSPAYRLLMGEI